MNTLIKRAMLVAGITTVMSLPLPSQASDGTITFTGIVTANTCTIAVTSNGTTGGANATVALPTVSTAALDNTATKQTAAGTFFNVALSACTTTADIGAGLSHAPTLVSVYFEAGPNVDVLTGGLINTVTGSNVEVNLYNASAAAIVTNQIIPGETNTQTVTEPIAGGTQYFYAGYSTAGHAAAATAGAVNTSVTYSLVYQ